MTLYAIEERINDSAHSRNTKQEKQEIRLIKHYDEIDVNKIKITVVSPSQRIEISQ
jgi:hypothetical protein